VDNPNPMIVFYDGLCGFCDRTVQFILNHDKQDVFRFAPLQSELASTLLRKHGKNAEDLNTLYLLVDQGLPTERVLEKSTATVRIGKTLGGGAKLWASLLGVFPRFLRDLGYSGFAKIRYLVFGKNDSCRIPSPKDRAKFIGG
jgi:predicted DCC family thiol-disulfide oxidoreductase YuxK